MPRHSPRLDSCLVPLHILSRLVLIAPAVTMSDIRSILMIFDARQKSVSTWSQMKSRLGLTSAKSESLLERLHSLRFIDAADAQSITGEPQQVFSEILLSTPRRGVPQTAKFNRSTHFARWQFEKSTRFHVSIPDSEIENLGVDALAIYLRWCALQHIRTSEMSGAWAPFIGWRYRDFVRADSFTQIGIDRKWLDVGFLFRNTHRYVSVTKSTEYVSNAPGIGNRVAVQKWSPARISDAFETSKTQLHRIGIDLKTIRDPQRPDFYKLKIKDSDPFRFEGRLFMGGKPLSLSGLSEGQLEDYDYKTRVDLGQKRRSRDQKIEQQAIVAHESRVENEELSSEILNAIPGASEKLLNGVAPDPAEIKQRLRDHEAEIQRLEREEMLAARKARMMPAPVLKSAEDYLRENIAKKDAKIAALEAILEAQGTSYSGKAPTTWD